MKLVECESCAEGGFHGVPAVGNSNNPEWSGYDLCQECIEEYNNREPVNSVKPDGDPIVLNPPEAGVGRRDKKKI